MDADKAFYCIGGVLAIIAAMFGFAAGKLHSMMETASPMDLIDLQDRFHTALAVTLIAGLAALIAFIIGAVCSSE